MRTPTDPPTPLTPRPRFWYETSDPLLQFSPPQLTEIRQDSLAALLCRNMDQGDQILRWAPWVSMSPDLSPRSAMDSPSGDNPLVACAQLDHPDLRRWGEVQRSGRGVHCQVARVCGVTCYFSCSRWKEQWWSVEAV